MRTGWNRVVVALVAACSGGGTKPTTPILGMPGIDAAAAHAAVPALAIETPALVATPLANDPTRTTIHRLANGMTVYISPDPQEPSIVAHIAVRAGGRHDPRQSTGLAHYLEHMLFKGTARLGTLDYAKEKPHLENIAALYAELRNPGADRERVLKDIDAATQDAAAYAVPNELDQLYARMGITGLNAFTTTDATVYTVEVPSNRIAQWARVEAQRFTDPVWRLFWPELEAVYEEKNTGLDDPAERVSDAMLKRLFPDHGYGWGGSVIGEIEHLKSPAYQDMDAFFRRYYTPSNMAILLAGDVDASVLPLLENEFAILKRPAGAAVDPGQLTKLTGRTELEVEVPSDEGVLLAWPTVPAIHPDALALELMDLVVFDGESGILTRDLVLTQKVASAQSGANLLREAGYYELSADALDGQTHAELERLVLDVVEKLRRGAFTDADIATAILTYEAREQRTIESNEGRMGLMLDAFVLGRDWRDVVTKIDRMRKLAKTDVVAIANRYLTSEYLIVNKRKATTLLPKITKPTITPVKLDTSRQTVFAKAILAMPVTPIEPLAIVEGKDFVRGALPTGELISATNKRNGLFELTFEYAFGRADDRLACTAIGILDVVGAGKRSAEQIARRFHELGLSFATDCSRTTTTLTLSGLDRNLEQGMALVRELLADPAIDVATVKARVASTLTDRANALATPHSVQSAQAMFARYGADSELLVVPSNQQLRAVTPAQLRQRLAQYLRMTHRTAYFGPRAQRDALPAITLGDGKLATKPPRAVRYRKPNLVLATHQDTAQTHLTLVWPQPPAGAAERALGSVFSAYASTLLYQEVREARGLAYTVYGGYDPGNRKGDDASVYAFAGVQGDKAHDAVDSMLATLRQPIDARRLDTAKETVAQNHRVERIPPRAIAAIVYEWQDQGERADPRAARVQRALAIDQPTLEHWVAAALAKPVIASVTGDRTKLDEAKLRRLAPLTWVPIASLFGF